MNPFLLGLCSVVLWTHHAWAGGGCFLLKEQGSIAQHEGDATTRYSPCSSFKIALALMGYDAGVLKDKNHPEWPFKEGYDTFLEAWKQAQTPTTWMKHSCVWFSKLLAENLGMERVQAYKKQFEYGNQALFGSAPHDPTVPWISGPLEISPEEQAYFLEKLLADGLPVSQHAHTMTQAILYLEDLPYGWKWYGKTGSGTLLSPDRSRKTDLKHGWFVGWIQKGNTKIICVHHLVDSKKEETQAGPRAKAQTKQKLIQFIKLRERTPKT
jgi:beta-lactamase class D